MYCGPPPSGDPLPHFQLPGAPVDGHPDGSMSGKISKVDCLAELPVGKPNVVQTLSHALNGLSHDLREPIRTVLCYSELLNRSSKVQLDPNLAEYVHFINGAAARMDALLEGMLEFARVVGQESPPREPVDLNLVVQTALANLQMKIEEAGATIVADSLPPVHGDGVQLTQLVQNLIANSLKYRSSEAPQITIRCERVDGGWLCSIQDNGIGIESRHHASIFTPFKRLHGPEFPGVGLGLAMCRQIVELHRGHIFVESTPGKGSIFSFTLPDGLKD